MISSPRTTIDLTMEDDDPRQPKRIKTDVGSTPSPQPYPSSSVSSFPAQNYSYSASSSSTPYQSGSPWTSQGTPVLYDPQAQQSPYPAGAGATQSPMPYRPYTPSSQQSPTTHQTVFPAGQYSSGSGPIYTPQQAAQYAPSSASAYRTAPPRTVIDLTGQQPPSPYAAQQSQASGAGQSQQGQQAVASAPAKDVRRDVVCIGQLTATALILYPVPYVCPKPDQPLASLPSAGPDGYIPVRLKYDDVSKRRQRNPAQSGEETIQIQVPHYKGGASGTESLGGDEFGVVEQRIATVLGPLMAKVLIRLEAHVRRATSTTAPILPLRVLVFTPRGNVKVVASYLHSGGLTLEHPSIPYIPSEHRDNPPYENPHQAGIGAPDYRYNNTVQNRWTSQAISGKSVEVQRSQVDEVFKSLRSGEELTETDAGKLIF
jgi:SWI/SNF-related matrix-associated actin-dependent regulator of chromatin subfamily A3